MVVTPSSSGGFEWANDPLVLYHGTSQQYVDSIITEVVPGHGRILTDFGRGFYTTTVLDRAVEWARHVSGPSIGHAAVVEFEVDRDELARLDSMWFVLDYETQGDFWRFVSYCRGGGGAHGRSANGGWYDLVVGPASTWPNRGVHPDFDQVSFHTAHAAEVLNRSDKLRVY